MVATVFLAEKTSVVGSDFGNSVLGNLRTYFFLLRVMRV